MCDLGWGTLQWVHFLSFDNFTAICCTVSPTIIILINVTNPKLSPKLKEVTTAPVFSICGRYIIRSRQYLCF
jgi:hypothetical protein